MEENLGRPDVWPETDQPIERGSEGQVARRVPDADEEDEDAGGGEQSDETVFGEEVGVYEESADWREKIAVENETELYEDETGAAAEKAEQREKSGEAGRGEEAVGRRCIVFVRRAARHRCAAGPCGDAEQHGDDLRH